VVLFITAIKSEIIEELEKHRDAELAEQREKRHKAEAEKARKNAEQPTNTEETTVVNLLSIYTSTDFLKRNEITPFVALDCS